ncbi:MAG: hypothetical protein LBP62_08110 [Clostridiales bacterium]|jgi:hypothetical protein|nr:hypothetical protein [Clostridiales bacterium]
MIEKYVKAINCITDIMKGIECVNLSMGASDKEGFAWIATNLDAFKREAIENYNKVISVILRQRQIKLYYVVCEKKDSEFSAVEKHLGIWHKFKDISFVNRSKDFYAKENLRYAYAILDCIKPEQLSILRSGDLVFAKDDGEIVYRLKELAKEKTVFNCFYDSGFILANFRDLWTDGNALVFYSKDKQELNNIKLIAEKKGFSFLSRPTN